MITVQLSGGFGNQLFQYAAGLSLADQLGTTCFVDLGAYEKNIRKYELKNFISPPIIANSRELPLAIQLSQLRLPGQSIINRLSKYISFNSNIFHEKSPFMYDDRFENLRDGAYLIGYFQTEKYFNKYSALIRNQFQFTDELSHDSQKILDQIKTSKTSISVHIRRGDYVSNQKAQNFHGVCPLDYYRNAFQYIENKIENPTYYIFSDDPEWVKFNIKTTAPAIYVHGNAANQDLEDFRLMSSCSHHIIANSSFSWWAAWLNPHTEKIVIAPKKWITSTEIKYDDIIPTKWITI
ncbi:MAG: alpha-1,2-fucosyltransferase [Bacteriovorax sp.]